MVEQPSAPNSPVASPSVAPSISLVIPCFNEANQIDAIVDRWELTLRSLGEPFEILVINDGSTDGTGRVLDKLRKESKTLRVIHQLQMGLGASTRRGIELARGAFVFVGDCKEPMATEDAVALWGQRGESLMVLGYRPSWEARGWRRFFGRFLFLWVRLLFGSRLRDPNTPFRLVHRETAMAYLQYVPPYYQSINLLLAVLIERDYPSQVLENSLRASGIAGLRGGSSNMHYFWFVVGSFLELTRLRLRYPTHLSLATQAPASVRV